MEEESELIALRRQKLDALRALGVAPFGQSFETSGSIADVREKFEEGKTFRVAGRITAHRDMGKSHFLDLRDASGRIQIYVQAKELGPEAMEIFALLDLGDFIGVEGSCFVTKTGEPTLKVHKFEVLGEVASPAPGEMARPDRCRGTLPTALSRSDHERAFARGLCETDRDSPRDAAFHGSARFS